MNTAWLCVTVVVLYVLKSTDAQVTDWSEPVIDAPDGSGTIETAVAEGETITLPKIVATGASTDANTYTITSQNPDGIFEITTDGGQLSLVGEKVLDYETAPKHVLIVTAVGSDGSTGTATITINISDVNDNPPEFPTSGYSACVVDNAMIGTEVLTVSTTDIDTTTTANVISEMTITDGDTNNDFAIATDGVITLASVANMATTDSYTLTVTATDSDSANKLTGTTTVSVTVADNCGGVGGLAASLLTMLVGLMTSLSLF